MEQQRLQNLRKDDEEEPSENVEEEEENSPLENQRFDPNNMTFSEAKQPGYKDLNEF
jgi:hypothetical protein